jgi:aminoglycoside phosphotransferase (APT) family kinase protein
MTFEANLNALAPRLIEGGLRIDNLRRLSGGASQETWAFEAVSQDASRALILRRRPPGAAGASGTAIPLATEAALIQITGERGALVPPIAHVCVEADGVGEAYVMGAIEGEALGRRIVRDEAFAGVRPQLAYQCGQSLAAIHSTPLADLPDLPAYGALEDIDRYWEIYRSYDHPKPILEMAFKYLRAQAPKGVEQVLIHGDFRNGNIMFSPKTGVAAILDWELAHIGDPAADMGWVCTASWRFGGAGPVGGFGQYEDLLAGYEAAGGKPISLERVLYWEMLGSLKWGCMCMGMYSSFASGSDPSVERAMIGRRTSETESDLMYLLERLA